MTDEELDLAAQRLGALAVLLHELLPTINEVVEHTRLDAQIDSIVRNARTSADASNRLEALRDRANIHALALTLKQLEDAQRKNLATLVTQARR